MRRRIATTEDGSIDWAAIYAGWLGPSGPAFREVFLALAVEDALPAVFHGTGGRDRTGAVALLGMLGVADDLIARDHALTGIHLQRSPGRPERLAAFAAQLGVTPERVLTLVQTTRDTAHHLLTAIRATYGSVGRYLERNGVPVVARASLRERLVET
jgi:protein tyrosine/serine phosphatase